MNCAYCTSTDIPNRVILENDLVRAFPTNIPIVPGHTLITPLRHVTTYEELTHDEKDATERMRLRLQSALRSAFGCEGFNYAWNEGTAAGQSVPHFHLHMLPRSTGDEGVHQYEPREFIYRPGSRATTPEAELASIAVLVRKYL